MQDIKFDTPRVYSNSKTKRVMVKRMSPFFLLAVFLIFLFPCQVISSGNFFSARLILFPFVIANVALADFAIWNYFHGRKRWLTWTVETGISSLIIYWLTWSKIIIIQMNLSISSPENVLSFREFYILQLISEGCSTNDISIVLNVTSNIVEAHTKKIKEKLGTRYIREAIVKAGL